MSAGIDSKPAIDEISDDVVPSTERPVHAKLEPPPLVAAMSQEYRMEAEAKLRRKIDTRLLPMIILMYIMNYLDRNNIAAVRLAGLQDELKLTSTQYQVSLLLLSRSRCRWVTTTTRDFSFYQLYSNDCRPLSRFCSLATF